jgi:catechol 2,3-dioxygenase-like lactoylglutathione lyase family enzyme
MKANLQKIHPVLMAGDVLAALEFYRRLGFAVVFQDDVAEPKYAAVRRDEVELHIQWADAGQWAYPTDRPAYRFLVSDIDALYADFVAAGVVDRNSPGESPWAAPARTPWGTYEFHLRDPGKNSLQFYMPMQA